VPWANTQGNSEVVPRKAGSHGEVKAGFAVIGNFPLMALYVYILRCSDGSYYTGITDDPRQRLEQHQQGMRKDAYTFTRRPVDMVYCMHFPDGTHDQAQAWEKKLKGWSRAKKEAVIDGRWNDLPALVECRNETHHRNKDT
jgi:putative endonuclease